MGREAQGKASRTVLSGAAAASRASARRWAQPAGSPNDPPPPAAARPRLPLVPGTCPTRRCFQHSRQELSRSSTPGKYLFRDLAPAEEEIKPPRSRAGGAASLSVCPSRLPPRPEACRLGPGPGIPPPTQAGFGAEPGVPAVCASRSGVTVSSKAGGASWEPGTALGPGCHG